MTDPWAPPGRDAPLQYAADTTFADGTPRRISLRSVPDGRAPVAATWWMPLFSGVILAVTTADVVRSGGPSIWWAIAANGTSLIGYFLAWRHFRPRQATTRGSDQRRVARLLGSACVALGFSAAWALVVSMVIRERIPVLPRSSATVAGGLLRAALASLQTSILEECGIAVLILAVAGLAGRYLPSHWDPRSPAVTAIVTATVARTLLHIPLWGWGAVGRIGLSFLLAWVFFRTRRVWPLILAHLCWDTLALQTFFSPSLQVKGYAGLIIIGWAIAGTVVAIMAIRGSVVAIRRSAKTQSW